jgi:AcrR family transcriptional regulator
VDLTGRGATPERGTRRRGPELEDAILAAAWDVLVDRGYRGFTYEAIAAAAGTSRPVLYRRWPRREDLLLAALRVHWWGEPIDAPDTGSVRDDALGLLREASTRRSSMVTVVTVQLVDYFRDSGTSFSELRDVLRPDRPNVLEEMVARAVARGEIPDAVRSPRVISLPFDLFRHEILMTMKAVPDETLRQIVDDIWLPLLMAPGAGGSAQRSLPKQSESSKST